MSKPRCITCGNAYPCSCPDLEYICRPVRLVASPGASGPECSSSWIGHLTKPGLQSGVGKARFDAGTFTRTVR